MSWKNTHKWLYLQLISSEFHRLTIICRNGLGLQWDHPKGTDFGTGIYIVRSVLDASYVDQRSTLANSSNSKQDEDQNRPTCIVFRCPKEEFDT
ncbi:unnamed protein product [Rotaria sordida]|uniref:Uncharacterized protein n=1 Tax=Rotaria sordida TaxID=392033 RepID=A0A815VLG8_9BILA|nr:unnamed protein product [Rotaria sordida]CAF1537278.1 unnamed protein product [Rotaria sordida]